MFILENLYSEKYPETYDGSDIAFLSEEISQKPDWPKQFRDSFLPRLTIGGQKNVTISIDGSTTVKEISPTRGPEVEELKQHLATLQNQILEIQKGMTQMTQAQDQFKTSLDKNIELKIKTTHQVTETKEVPVITASDEYLDLFKKSGMLPHEFQTCLVYIKQINHLVKADEKPPSLIKVDGKMSAK